MQELAPGLWRWTGYHPVWRQEVGCVYLETPDGVCLVDPLVPPEDADRFLAALDRDVARLGGRVHVLVTVYWHSRSAGELVPRYRGRLWAPSRGRAAVERRAGEVTDPFPPGDPLPGGVRALPTGRGSEVVYWLPEHRTLVPGDVVIGAEDGGIRLCPPSWLPTGTTLGDVRETLRPLLDLDVERVLPSHGEPVLAGGAEALRAALAGVG